MAARIGQSQNLHLESSLNGRDVFDQQMRCRLWHAICYLDSHSSTDRGTNCVIRPDEFSTPLPLHVSDAELVRGSYESPTPQTEMLPITLPLLALESCAAMRRLETLMLQTNPTPQLVWKQRQDVAVALQKRVESYYANLGTLSSPFERFYAELCSVIPGVTSLMAVRPIQPTHAMERPPISGPKLLSMCIGLLDHFSRLYRVAEFRPWQWNAWILWHPLAVAIGELCVQTEGPLVEHAWEIVDVAYKVCEEGVADTRRGLLWRPISKLMRRAQELRLQARQRDLRQNNPGTFEPTEIQISAHDTLPHDDLWQMQSLNMTLDPDVQSLSQTSNQWTGAFMDALPMQEADFLDLALNPQLDTNSYSADAWQNWENFIDDVHHEDISVANPAAQDYSTLYDVKDDRLETCVPS